MTLVQHIAQWLQRMIWRLTVRCGTSVADFGPYPGSRVAFIHVNTGVTGVSPRAGCVTAQIAPIETAALGDSPGHTMQDHVLDCTKMTVLCGIPDANGYATITVVGNTEMVGRYSINWQRIV